MFKPIKVHSVVILVLSLYNVHMIYKKYMSQKLLSRNKNGMLHLALQEKKSLKKKNPGFECENQIQSSGTAENVNHWMSE